MGNGPAGTMSYTPRHIKFAVVDSTLYMKEVSRTGQNMIFSSSANQNMQEGLKKNSLSTIVDAFTIAAFNKDSFGRCSGYDFLLCISYGKYESFFKW